jgi:hypothetical protein
MFEDVIARFDEMIERQYPSATPESAGLLERIGAFSRVENRGVKRDAAGVFAGQTLLLGPGTYFTKLYDRSRGM